MTVEAMHSLKDPSALTPYEEKLLALRSRGLTYQQMSEELNGASNWKSIAARFKIIKEKIELIKAEREYDDYR